MPGIKWATENELLFLTTKVDEYHTIHTGGRARVRNPAKVGYLNEVFEEFEKLFPTRLATMDLPRIGTAGSMKERKEVLIEVSIFCV